MPSDTADFCIEYHSFSSDFSSMVCHGKGMQWLGALGLALQQGQPLHMLLFSVAIIFFAFYTALVFNPKETADNLKKSGAFIPGIRPGEQTAKYIDAVMNSIKHCRFDLCDISMLLPEFMILTWNVPFYFGGTSLLIILLWLFGFYGSSAGSCHVVSI